MALSQYHQKYSNQSDEEIQKRSAEKEQELLEIFRHVSLQTGSETIRIAVLGCGDKRFVQHHKAIFEKVLGKPVVITTFDISTEHLQGEENIVQHDCTLPLPNQPFDITFAHVLLRFIETEKQWDLLKTSYEALRSGGVAIHVLDREDYETTDIHLKNGLYAVPLERWKKQLGDENIAYKEIPVKYGLALIILR